MLVAWWDYLSFFFNRSIFMNAVYEERYIFWSIFALMGIELLFSRSKESTIFAILHPRRSDIWDVFSLSIGIWGVKKILSNLFFLGMVAFGASHFSKLQGYSGISEFPLWFKIILSAIIYDFLYYFAHRFRHKNSWLWNCHEFHHSSTRVTLFTTFRGHPLDSFLMFLLVICPVALVFDPSFISSVSYYFVKSFFGLLNHARIDTNFGILGQVFMSPRQHHSHHRKDGIYSNFGEIFVFWDKIFGTYKEADRPIYEMDQGLEDNFYDSANPVNAYLRPVWRIYAMPIGWLKKYL